MIPNNNLSVLPWYTSIDQQNARKWWVYGRVYPLFTPAGYMLPFQLMRPTRTQYMPGNVISPIATYSDKYIDDDGTLSVSDAEQGRYDVGEYDVTQLQRIYLTNTAIYEISPYYTYVFLDSSNIILASGTTAGWSGAVEVPDGAIKLYVQFEASTTTEVCQAVEQTLPISVFAVYTKDGELVGNYNPDEMGISIVPFVTLGYDVIVFPGRLPVFPSMQNGQYYALMSDGMDVWYSEIFTVVNDISPYLKLEWWDVENFVMDAGTIVYQNPAFKNVLYLKADIAKPDYPFEEEGETRDGYFFPTKQISEKRYRFAFFAPEYLLDVMRFVRMADYAQITKDGKTYSLDTFLITPEWEDNGDVASVDAEFDTATVAKKIGLGYIKAQRGDFNDDFNNDYNT